MAFKKYQHITQSCNTVLLQMYTCYAPTIDYYVPAMLASGLIYKVRGVEEMENYDVIPASDETSLRRDHHAGFLRNFLVTKVDEYDWYRMDYAEDEWAYIYIIIYADDLSAEHLVQMFEVNLFFRKNKSLPSANFSTFRRKLGYFQIPAFTLIG